MNKSFSSNNFSSFTFNLKKSSSFNDFNILLLKGSQKFLSYGQFFYKNNFKPLTRNKRQKVIRNYYKQLLG